MMIKFEWVNENNYAECANIRQQLFDYSFNGNIYERIAKKKNLDMYFKIDYAIIKNEKDESIGTIGYYMKKESLDRCWIGWYGILPQFRGMGLGDKILDFYIDYIKKNIVEAKYLCVYTDYAESKAAIHGYTKHGMILEEGRFYKDYHCDKWCILGMSLKGQKYEMWNKEPLWCED